MKEIVVAFDTSNYTTSCAFFDGENGENCGRLLDVKKGELGLRQSEALFSHVKRLPEIAERLGINDSEHKIVAVGASTKPRETENSYMPCFLAGMSQAKVLAEMLNVPFFGFSHQQGHIAAAAWSAGHEELMEMPHLAWHLSGGTTELLYVKPYKTAVLCEIVGETTDIAAGQLVDRTGKLLGLAFPSGKELDKLASASDKELFYVPKFDGMSFSMSGIEHKMKQLYESGERAENIARFSIASIVETVQKVTERAIKKYGKIPVLYSGGVASNSILRQMTPEGIFAKTQFSTDNAMGCAILTYRAFVSGVY